MRKIHKKQIVTISFVLCVLILLKWFHITDVLRIEWLHQNIALLRDYVNHQYSLSVALFIVAYAAASVCAVPGTSIFFIAAGLLFGSVAGAVYGVIGATIGASSLFLLSRHLLGAWVQERYHHKFQRFNSHFQEHGIFYLVMIRFVTLLPFFVVNLLTGVTMCSLATFAWTTALGLVPKAVLYTFLGQRLAMIDSIDDLYSAPFIIIFGLLIAFQVSLVPIIYKRIKNRKRTVQLRLLRS